jgi:hypothetical protein
VAFVYENRPNSDVDVAYVAGTPIRQIVRLDRIDALFNGSVLRRFELSYQPALSVTGRSRLASVQECGAGGAECLAATNFDWQDGTSGRATHRPFHARFRVPPIFRSPTSGTWPTSMATAAPTMSGPAAAKWHRQRSAIGSVSRTVHSDRRSTPGSPAPTASACRSTAMATAEMTCS